MKQTMVLRSWMMSSGWYYLAAVAFVFSWNTGLTASQDAAPAPAALLSKGSNVCLRATTCSACMESSPICNWCITKDFGKTRCNTRQGLIDGGCIDGDIINKQTEKTASKEAPVSDGDTLTGTVQLSPQQLSVKLRPNQPYKFDLTFRLAKDYPVDLYYLMDLSQSMADDKDKVSSLGLSLASEMRSITRNVRLGFGSFVDKVALPYVNMLPTQLQAPCPGCEGPYSFRNRLSLTEDVAQFGIKVNATPVSGNQDSPEGGFDAIVQAVKCNDDIGWRNFSRKLLLVSTDADFHVAGDGKLGGIVEPNDGLCHMSNGEYTWATRQDYPSISQLGTIIKEQRINMIFAVTSDQADRYKQLSGFLDGSVAGVLEADSANIVQLVKENFQKIASKVEMKTRGLDVDSGISVTMSSTCGGTTTGLSSSGVCDNLRPGQQVTFKVELVARSCAGRREWKERFNIYPVGLSESLEIFADVICECDCNDKVEKSPYCNSTGTFQCGTCSCDAGFDGERCECNLQELRMDVTGLEAACMPPNSTSSLTLGAGKCTGRGDCLCGKCRCGCRPGTEHLGEGCERYEGKWCQCDVYNCERGDNGLLCSGNGKCTCDELTGKVACSCNKGFEGSRCDCALSEEGCLASNTSKEVCSGHGTCSCGRCSCIPDSLGNYYIGTHCEDCATCAGKCNSFKECVQCHAFGTGPLSKEQCAKTCNHTYVRVQEIAPGEKYKCLDKDEQDCTFEYSYGYRRSGYIITVKDKRECPKEVPVLGLVLGVIGGILFLGLAALLIWKLVTTIHDRREFARFEKERQTANWGAGENPIYVKATSTFKNPMYAGAGKST